jgi:hypothetical protein
VGPKASGVTHEVPLTRSGTTWAPPDEWEDHFWPGRLWRLPPIELPLYGIEWVDTVTVVLVEGERCAEMLWRAGVAAVGTRSGAADGPGHRVLAELNGLRVILWPSSDVAGREYMQRVAQALASLDVTMSWIEPPEGVSSGWNAADALREPDGLTKVERLIAGAQPLTRRCVE